MRLSRDELKNLMKVKMMRAGLTEEHAEQTAEILTWSHERGYASHGAVRVEYYSERIAKGGITNHPQIHLEGNHHIDDGEVPFLFFLIPSGTDSFILKKLYLIILLHDAAPPFSL